MEARRDSSDFSAPSAQHGQGHTAPRTSSDSGAQAKDGTLGTEAARTGEPASPFDLETSTGAASSVIIPHSSATHVPIKLEHGPDGQAELDGENGQAVAGPGPSSMANAVKREYVPTYVHSNPLKRRKLEAAQYTDIEKVTHCAAATE